MVVFTIRFPQDMDTSNTLEVCCCREESIVVGVGVLVGKPDLDVVVVVLVVVEIGLLTVRLVAPPRVNC